MIKKYIELFNETSAFPLQEFIQRPLFSKIDSKNKNNSNNHTKENNSSFSFTVKKFMFIYQRFIEISSEQEDSNYILYPIVEAKCWTTNNMQLNYYSNLEEIRNLSIKTRIPFDTIYRELYQKYFPEYIRKGSDK